MAIEPNITEQFRDANPTLSRFHAVTNNIAGYTTIPLIIASFFMARPYDMLAAAIIAATIIVAQVSGGMICHQLVLVQDGIRQTRNRKFIHAGVLVLVLAGVILVTRIASQ